MRNRVLLEKVEVKFQTAYNSFEAKNLHSNCMELFSDKCLNLRNVRKISRKTRNYLECTISFALLRKKYKNLNGDEALELAKLLKGVDIDSLSFIEHNMKKRKCHRNILDID